MCKISVIIPAYNVEKYIDECIDSLINQTFKDFEIIVVDDGSTDSTGYILNRYSKILNNFRVINQKNSGSPGGPRNRGIELSNGEYIFMLDPDDVLPYTALEKLYSCAEKEKADMVCGNYLRFNSKKAWTLKHISETIFMEEKITNLREFPEVMINGITCNKLYRLDFINRYNIRYNEKLKNGEDRIFMLKAYLHADKIQIIPNIVYKYRDRENEGNLSTTQQFNLKVFEESLDSIIENYNYLIQTKNELYVAELFRKERTQHDFFRFINYYAEKLPKEKWSKVFEISREYMDIMYNYIDKLPYFQRIKIHYIKNRNYEGLIKFCKKERKRYFYSIDKINDKWIIKDIHIKGTTEINKINVEDLVLKYKINYINIKEDILNIDGTAYFNRLNISNSNDISKILVLKGYNDEVELELESYKTRKLSLKQGKGIFHYSWSGFKGSYNILNLYNLVNAQHPEVKIFLKVLISEKLYKEVFIYNLDIYGYLNKDKEDKLIQRLDRIYYEEQGIRFLGWANLAYKKKNEAYEKNIVLVDKETKIEYRWPTFIKYNRWYNDKFETNPYKYNYNFGGWECFIPYEEINSGIYDLYIELKNCNFYSMHKISYVSPTLINQRIKCENGVISNCKKYKVELSTSEYNRQNCQVELLVNSIYEESSQMLGGYIPIIGDKLSNWDGVQRTKIILSRIQVTYSQLILQGKYVGDKDINLLCAINNKESINKTYKCKEIYEIYGEVTDNGWQVSIPYNQVNGEYDISIIDNSGNIINNFEIEDRLIKNDYVWGNSHYIKSVKLDIHRIEQNNLNVFKLKLKYNTNCMNLITGKFKKLVKKIVNNLPLKFNISHKFKSVNMIYVIFYAVFKLIRVNNHKVIMLGYQDNINPNFKPIYEQLTNNHKNLSVKYIGGNKKSLIQLIKLLYEIATSGTILVNDYYRHIYPLKIRKNTKVIQIWHATGIFKKFGLLALGKNDSNKEEFEVRAHKSYTHIVVSSEYVRKPYAQAFGLSIDKTMALGVARTDMFFDKEYIEKTKNALIEKYSYIKGKKIILYAPTFRGSGNDRKKFRNQLEFNKMKSLKDKGYIILVKLHPVVKEKFIIPINMKDFVYDMTDYPDINDLFLITDILITDYSSNMFEFALLRKPIILFAYDLDKYLLERGFYDEYEEMVPGPICRNTEDLVDSIENFNNNKFNYEKFINKYLDKCDGHSTERIVNLILNNK